MASAWGKSFGAAWGNAWGAMAVLQPAAPGGGGYAGTAGDGQLHRDHWDYLDSLREIQVQVADDIRGVRSISIPVGMPLPAEIAARAMHGSIAPAGSPPTVANILNDPLLMSMLALLIDEATDDY